MKELVRNYKRIVIKIGASIFFNNNKLDYCHLNQIIASVSHLIGVDKREVIIVSSGAIALGMDLMKMDVRPKSLPMLQAAASIGQNILMDNYSRCFKAHKLNCAQVLLTWDDLDSRKRYLNAKNTLLALLKLGVVPIINENDTVSTDEIKFGDNDTLSARVASLACADLLVILSDVDGLMDKDANVIPIVSEITPSIKQLACPTDKKTCVGGMITKLDAAKIAVDSGIPCVIANGYNSCIISSVVNEPEKNGTLFLNKKRLAERERWIAFGTKPKGKVRVDDGAKKAIIHKKSLLSVGINGVEGNFEGKEIVSILDREGKEIARGKTLLSSRQIEKVAGSRSEKEVIHCDDMVIL